MVDGHQSLCLGNAYSSSRSQCIPLCRCQSLRMGSSSRIDESVLSWSLVGRPISTPYQYTGNNGHSFRNEESHKIYTLFLCHDFYRQHNSGLLYQKTRRNTFSQPMCRGMGDPPWVPGTRCHYQSPTYPRQIQYFGRLSLENGQTSQNRMGIGSISCKLHFPNIQLTQCGSVCDTLQSQTPIEGISSSRQSCRSDRRIINELESSSCFCVSSNNSNTFCSSQDTSISVQNSSYCPSLAPMPVVLRGITTVSISSNSSSALSKTIDTSKRKVSTPKSPIPWPSCLGVIKQSTRD